MKTENENLSKSIDTLIDELFAETLEKAQPEKVAIAEKKPSSGKSIGDDQKPVMTADENGAKKEGEEDEEEGKKRGRPSDLSQVSMRDENGASKGKYDSSITEPAKKVPNETTVAKSFEVSAEEYELLQKAKAAIEKNKQEQELKKAREEQSTLIKSAVAEATKGIAKENEELKKSLAETQALIKSLAKKPQPRKSISSVQVMEKSFGSSEGSVEGKPQGEAFSKSEMLDAAEALVKSGKISVDQAIELEDTGFIFDAGARKALEAELQKRK